MDNKTTEQNNNGLVQSFGLFTLIMIVLSSMIGSGVFKKIAQMSAYVQSPWLVMLAWILAGLVSLFGALGNAEVGGMITEPGGQYAYFKYMYGRFVAYMYGWTMLAVVQTATAAAVAIVFAQAVSGICGQVYGHELSEMTVKMLGIGAIVLFTAVNYFGAELSGSFNSVLMGLIVTALVGIIIADLTMSNGSMANISHIADANGVNLLLQNACKEAGIDINDITSISDLQQHLKELKDLLPEDRFKEIANTLNLENMQTLAKGNEGVIGSSVSFLNGLFAAMLGAFWAYEGWNNVGYLGAEVKNPQRNIPLGLTVGVLIVMAIYTLINFSYLYAMPIEELINVHLHVGKIGAVEVLKTYMSGGVIIVLGIIGLANFNTTNNSILASPRVTYAMAVDGLFFKEFAAVHPKYKTPTLAILFMGFWASCFVISGQFDALTEMLVFASFIFYFMAAIGVFILRKKMPDTPRAYKVSLIFPAIFAIFSAGLVFFTIYKDYIGAFGGLKDYSLGAIFNAFISMNSVRGLCLMALGIPLYFYFESKSE